MTAHFNVEVEDKKKYTILKEIHNYYSDFISNPMANDSEVKLFEQIIEELFSEERNGFAHFVIEFFEDGKEIEFDNLKEAYNEYSLEQTSVIRTSKWIG